MSVRQLFDSLMAHATTALAETRALAHSIGNHRQETAIVAAKLDRSIDGQSRILDALSYLAQSINTAFAQQEQAMSEKIDAARAAIARLEQAYDTEHANAANADALASQVNSLTAERDAEKARADEAEAELDAITSSVDAKIGPAA